MNETTRHRSEVPGGGSSTDDRLADTALVGVLIVNWNAWADTLAAYHSLDAQGGVSWRAFIVDNASGDGSSARIAAGAPDAVLIQSCKNRGFAGGVNLAADAAVAGGCDYLFLLNNDATLEAGALARLVETSRRLSDAAILGCAVRYFATDRFQFVGSRTHPGHGLPSWFSAEADPSLLERDLISTDFVLGAAMFIPRALADGGPLFDERFFLNYEETDLCYRARGQGAACFVVPRARVSHRASSTVGPHSAPLQTYFLARNELLFIEKHGTLRHRWGLYVHRARQVWRSLRASWSAGLTLNSASRAMLMGVFDYARRRFGDCSPLIRRLAAEAREETPRIGVGLEASHSR